MERQKSLVKRMGGGLLLALLLSTLLITCRAESEDSHPIWTVTFDTDGGNDKITAKTIEDGGTVSRPKSTTLKKSGYVDFNASTGDWIKDDGSIFRFSNEENPDIVYSDITLRPSWKSKKDTNTPDASKPGDSNPQENDPSKPNDPNSQGSDLNNPDSQGNDSTTSLIAWKSETENVLVLGGNLPRGTEIVYYGTLNGNGNAPIELDVSAFDTATIMARTNTINGEQPNITTFQVNFFTVTFLSSNGMEISISKIHSGGKVTSPLNGGTAWYKYDDNGNELLFDFDQPITSNIILQKVAQTWTVSYSAGAEDATMIFFEDVTISEGQYFALPYNSFAGDDGIVRYHFERDGYSFIGYKKIGNTSGEGETYSENQDVNITENTTFIAQWVKGLAITFNNASGGGGSLVSENVNEGVSFTLPLVCDGTATGRIWNNLYAARFKGWATSENSKTVAYQDGATIQMGSENITLYALWDEIEQTITFKIGETVYKTQAGKSKTRITLQTPATSDIPQYKTFLGWRDVQGRHEEKRANDFKYNAGESYEILFNTTLEAVLGNGNCTISFESGGGTGVKASETATYNGEYTLPGNKDANGNDCFSKAGYYFTGWQIKDAYSSWPTLNAGTKYTVNGDIIFVARWGDKPEISFNANGGEGSIESIKASYGESVTLPGNKNANGNDILTRTGYNFSGWATSENATANDVINAWTVQGSATLYAVWSAKDYSITFNANGGTGTIAPISEKYDSVATLPTVDAVRSSLQKTNYVFVGWGETDDSKVAKTSITVKGDATLYAIWEGKECTITLNANGGGGGQTSIKRKYGETVTFSSVVTNTPTRQNYDFSGWATSATSKDLIPTLKVTENTTLYAVWDETTYTITFNPNNISGEFASGTQANINKKYNETVTLPTVANYTKEHYNFAGWATDKNASVAQYCGASGVTSYKITQDVTLYAVWTPKTYTISFDAGGGSGTRASDQAQYKTNYQIPDNKDTNGNAIFTKSGFYFLGWKIKVGNSESPSQTIYREGDNYVQNRDNYLITNNITLVAQWSSNFVITFDANGGTGTQASMNCGRNETITLPEPTFTRTGYDFVCWSKNFTQLTDYNRYNVGSLCDFSRNTTFYAIWKIKTYTITFNANGGSGTASSISGIEHGVGIAFKESPLSSGDTKNYYYVPKPTRPHYDFCGWATSAGATDSEAIYYYDRPSHTFTNNTTLYAVWRQTVYRVALKSIIDGTISDLYGYSPTGVYGQEVTLPSDLERSPSLKEDHLVFCGWWTTNTQKTDRVTTWTITGNQETDTLYAVWEKEKIKFSFDANGGQGTQESIMTEYGNTSIPLPSETTFTREGYTFLGWATDASATIPERTSYLPFENRTFYAVWKINSYTVSFDANGGMGTQNAITKTHGKSVSLPQTSTFSKTGWTFKGWASSRQSTTPISNEYTDNASATLYAVWEINNYTVTFNANSDYYGGAGGVMQDVTKTYNEVYTLPKQSDDNFKLLPPSSSTSQGKYEFYGWTLHPQSDGSDIITELTVNRNVTLYAQWVCVEYLTDSNGKKTLSKYSISNCITNFVIPNDVASIGDMAFNGCTSLTSITIPDSVTSIGDGAFSWCENLTSMAIPNSVTSIGKEAFYNCNSLTSITIPNSVTEICQETFWSCDSLTSVTIPDSVTLIGEGAFKSCSLTSITIPNSVTSIGKDAFYNCNSLRSISIPNSVTSIGDRAFEWCNKLTSIAIPTSVTEICQETFLGCTSLTSVNIPNSVTSINLDAFGNCTSLTSITIPSSVTSIGSPFSYCTSLQTINVWWQEGQIPDGWYENWNAGCNATINYGVTQ